MAQTKKPFSSRMFRLVAGLVFCWMLLLNCLTPYLADDYTFAYAFDTGERLHSLPQLISSLVFHYHEWSGRVIVKFFAQGFTMFPKLLFNMCNAGMFMALGLVLYKLAVGRRSQKADWLALALIYAALWEISPVFGQTNLWMCGACNYLWATVGCCAFLLPWRYYLQQPFASTARMAAGMALAGLLAGWLSENTSAGMLVCLVLAGAVVFKRERRLPAWMAAGLAGALVGFALLITARGNFNRASGFSDYDSLLTRYAMRFFACLNMLKEYALPLLFSFAILFLLLCFARQDAVKADLLWPLILLAGALGAVLLGTVYGAVSGFFGGKTDMLMMRFLEILNAFPFMFFVILLVTFFGRNLAFIFVAIGMVSWLDVARIVRGQTLSLKRKEFVEAAEVSGVSNTAIVFRHIVPNVLGVVVVYASLLVPGMILFESFLSFLGLGVQEPMTSWGALLQEGAQTMQVAPWQLLVPSVFLVATLFCFNFIGDGLRDALDPKDR